MAESGAPGTDLNDLSKFCVTGRAGTMIFKEGDPADGAFIVEHGQVELVATSAEVKVAILGRGDVFGEGALFGDTARDVTARAVTDFQAYWIDRATFERLVQEDPLIGVGLAQRLAAYVSEQRGALAQPPGGDTPTKVSHSRRTRARQSAPAVPTQATFVLNGTGLKFVLAEKDSTIGRTDRKTGRAPDIDLTSADNERTISRLHARILFRDGRFYLHEEPGVRNGTFVNGTQVPQGRDVELLDGAQLRFGSVEATFVRRPSATGG